MRREEDLIGVAGSERKEKDRWGQKRIRLKLRVIEQRKEIDGEKRIRSKLQAIGRRKGIDQERTGFGRRARVVLENQESHLSFAF
jgi:hypothetical protein